MLTDIRSILSNVFEGARIDKHVTMHTFRHTHTAMRIQTVDQPVPVAK